MNLSFIRILVTTGLCLSSGIFSALLFDRFKDSQAALFTLPGILFGLAIVVSNLKVFRHKIQLALTTILLCIICWMTLLPLSSLLILSPLHPLVGLSIIGFISAVVVLLVFSIFMKFSNLIETAGIAGVAGITAFVIFYIITDRKTGAAENLEYLFVLWQTLVGFAISLGIKRTTSANQAHEQSFS